MKKPVPKPKAKDPKQDRRRYQRPVILSREALEVVAAVCSGPGKADYGSCPGGPISS